MLLILSYRRRFASTMKVPFDRDLFLKKLEGPRSTLKSLTHSHQAPPLFLVLRIPEVQLRRITLPRRWVNSPSSDAPGVVGWHHRYKRRKLCARGEPNN